VAAVTTAEDITTILAASGVAGCGMAAAGLALRKAVTHAVYSGYTLTWTLTVKPPAKPREPAPQPAGSTAVPAVNGHAAAVPSLVKGAAA
jgi:hypothetical protein